jgi:hypothetical protein
MLFKEGPMSWMNCEETRRKVRLMASENESSKRKVDEGVLKHLPTCTDCMRYSIDIFGDKKSGKDSGEQRG